MTISFKAAAALGFATKLDVVAEVTVKQPQPIPDKILLSCGFRVNVTAINISHRQVQKEASLNCRS